MKSKILRLKNREEVWLEDLDELRNTASTFCQSLYTAEQTPHSVSAIKSFLFLSHMDKYFLNLRVSLLEVKSGLFQMGGTEGLWAE